ncbi:hypothetical protein Q5P01_025553 [Channa striata]|uniref:Uncharacterized protein n=1 Tax=Channa striata TaxID=64152 RepID=A0AA88IIR8_CHASR|nr:hypothetical protein Q5P01_025553 [Channa striata]
MPDKSEVSQLDGDSDLDVPDERVDAHKGKIKDVWLTQLGRAARPQTSSLQSSPDGMPVSIPPSRATLNAPLVRPSCSLFAALLSAPSSPSLL